MQVLTTVGGLALPGTARALGAAAGTAPVPAPVPAVPDAGLPAAGLPALPDAGLPGTGPSDDGGGTTER